MKVGVRSDRKEEGGGKVKETQHQSPGRSRGEGGVQTKENTRSRGAHQFNRDFPVLASSNYPHPILRSFGTSLSADNSQGNLAGGVVAPEKGVRSTGLRSSSDEVRSCSFLLVDDGWEYDGWDGTVEIYDVNSGDGGVIGVEVDVIRARCCEELGREGRGRIGAGGER